MVEPHIVVHERDELLEDDRSFIWVIVTASSALMVAVVLALRVTGER